MSVTTNVVEYKCPCCDAGLVFGEDVQQMTCEYCGNTFELEAVQAFNEPQQTEPECFDWEESDSHTSQSIPVPSAGVH